MIDLNNYRKYLNYSVDEYHAYQLDRLQVFVKKIKKNSKYYHKKLLQYKDIQSFNDFQSLPLLNQDEIRNTPIEDLRATDWINIITVSCSSGTTGKSKLVLWSKEAVEEENKWITFAYLLLNVHYNSRLALLMPLELSRVPAYLSACQTIGTFSIPIGRIRNDLEMDNCIEKIKTLQATHIHASTSRLVSMTHRIKELGYGFNSDFKVKYLMGGALYISDETRNFLQKSWSAEFFDTCGSNETSFIGTECTQHEGMHIPLGINYIEVIDENTKKPIIDNKSVGEIIITNFANLGTPLLRYRIGDLGIINYNRCKCGLSSPRLYIKGRTSFTLFIGGTKLNANEVEETLAKFKNITNNYQAIISNKNNINYIHFKIENLKNNKLRNNADKIRKSLERASYEIYLKIKEGSVKMSVDLVPFESLERTGRDKIKDQVIDKRNKI